MSDSLARLRARLTAWYVGVFALILLLFGGALFGVVTRQIAVQLDDSLRGATVEVERAVQIRERERDLPRGAVVDALDELRIPGRVLYAFDAEGSLMHPAAAPGWVRAAALDARVRGEVWRRVETADDRSWRLFARRFTEQREPYVAVAVADAVEIEQQYPTLLASFALAALVSLVLVALGGAALARKSTEPVERSLERMRHFVADAAHELRTPTAVLRGRAEVALQRSRTGAEYVATLGEITREAEHLGRILDNLLLLASADAGQLPIRRERLYLDDLLLDAAGAARVLGNAQGVRVDITDWEEAPVVGDPELLRQLLMIVLDNAVKFTPPGGQVEASVHATPEQCRVRITDTGPGIPAAALPHVFERFHRADAARTRPGGAGLGLSIAQSIAAAHDASIRIRSREPHGAEVLLAFPRAG